MAKRLGESQDEVEQELRKAEAEGKAIDVLLGNLPARAREDAARLYTSLLVTRANLLSVVH